MKRHIPIILLLLIPAALLLSQEKSSKEYSDAINREGNVLEKLRQEIQENEKEMKDLSKRESDILSEIFPTKIRGRAMSIATMALWISCFSVAQTFPWLVEKIEEKTFFMFGGICVAAHTGSCLFGINLGP